MLIVIWFLDRGIEPPYIPVIAHPLFIVILQYLYSLCSDLYEPFGIGSLY